MATARSIGSLVITLGLVTIPAKLYTAHDKREVSFNRLVRATGARVKQQQISEADGAVLKPEEIVSGYEYTPGQFVTFTAEELKALELEGDPGRLKIGEVVPRTSIDARHITKTTLLGPDKGAERAYHLIASTLWRRGEVGIGQVGGRTRDELVVLAPIAGPVLSLAMHTCLYADEVRALEGVPTADLSDDERVLADRLIAGLERPTFDPTRFTDRGAERVLAAVERKRAGGQIVVPPPRSAAGAPVDLLEQLRASVPPGPKKASRRAPASQVQSGRRTRAAS